MGIARPFSAWKRDDFLCRIFRLSLILPASTGLVRAGPTALTFSHTQTPVGPLMNSARIT